MFFCFCFLFVCLFFYFYFLFTFFSPILNKNKTWDYIFCAQVLQGYSHVHFLPRALPITWPTSGVRETHKDLNRYNGTKESTGKPTDIQYLSVGKPLCSVPGPGFYRILSLVRVFFKNHRFNVSLKTPLHPLETWYTLKPLHRGKH